MLFRSWSSAAQVIKSRPEFRDKPSPVRTPDNCAALRGSANVTPCQLEMQMLISFDIRTCSPELCAIHYCYLRAVAYNFIPSPLPVPTTGPLGVFNMRYAHTLLFVCPDCNLPIAISRISDKKNLEGVDGELVQIKCAYIANRCPKWRR